VLIITTKFTVPSDMALSTMAQFVTFTLPVVTLLSLTTASPAFSLPANNNPSGAKCTTFKVSVDVSLDNAAVFGYPQPLKDSFQTTGILSDVVRRDGPVEQLITGTKPLKGTYDISVTYCEPKKRCGKNGVLQILTHGIGFDGRYAFRIHCIATQLHDRLSGFVLSEYIHLRHIVFATA
jgi:hypothetical protein